MKVERISDNQIKIIVDNNDLAERNIKLSELSFGNPEMIRTLFKDMMEQAMISCDFKTGVDSMFFVEVIPMSADSVMLIVTKTAENKQSTLSNFMGLDSSLNFAPKAKTERQFKQKPLIETNDCSNFMDSDIRIYSFATLDNLALACRTINGMFTGLSSAYKCKDKYYLMLTFDKGTGSKNAILLLNEFGQMVAVSTTSKSYLDEHGEVLISDGAVGVAAAYLC